MEEEEYKVVEVEVELVSGYIVEEEEHKLTGVEWKESGG